MTQKEIQEVREKVQTEITSTIIQHRFSGVIEASPRLGKTKPTIDAMNTIKKTELRILIMAPKIDILESWKKEFLLWGLNNNLTVEYIWSNSIKKVKDDYDLIVADEIHAYNMNVLLTLRRHQRKGTKILGLTGTLPQAKAFHIKNILKLDSIYEYSIKKAIDNKIVADYEIICIGCELDGKDQYILSGPEESPFYQSEKRAYFYWEERFKKEVKLQRFQNVRFLSSKRLNIIYNSKTKLELTKKLLEKEERCLVFSGRNEIADAITTSYHSKSKKTLDLFINKEINHLACVGMVSMGITIPDLKSVIFNQLKSVEELAIQQAMRAMNLQGDEKAKIQIVYLKNTQDEKWLKSALSGFDNRKIKYV